MADDLYDDLKPNMSDEEKKSYLIRVLNDFTDLRSSILGDENEPYFYIEQTIEDGVLSNTDFINCKGYRYSYDRLDDTEYRKKNTCVYEDGAIDIVFGKHAHVLDTMGDTAYYVKDEKGKWYATDKMPPNLGIYLRFPDNRSVQERLERIYKEQGIKVSYATDYRGYAKIRMSEFDQKITALENARNTPETNTTQEQASDSVEQAYSLANIEYFYKSQTRREALVSAADIYARKYSKISSTPNENTPNTPEKTPHPVENSPTIKTPDYENEDDWHIIQKKDIKKKSSQKTYDGTENNVDVEKIQNLENIKDRADKAITLYAQGKTDEADKVIPDFSKIFGEHISIQNNGNIYISEDYYGDVCAFVEIDIENNIEKSNMLKACENFLETGNIQEKYSNEQITYTTAILTEVAKRNHDKILKNPSTLAELTSEQKLSYEQSYTELNQLRHDLENENDDNTQFILNHVKNLSNTELLQTFMSPTKSLTNDEFIQLAENSEIKDISKKRLQKLYKLRDNPERIAKFIFPKHSDENLKNTLKLQAAQAKGKSQTTADEQNGEMSPEELKQRLKDTATNHGKSTDETIETATENAPAVHTNEAIDSTAQPTGIEKEDVQAEQPLTKADYIQRLRGIETPTMHKPTTQRNVNTALLQKSYRGR